ncbi:MAG TPA: formate dehydrogenase subunit gamma [Thiolinea sp.]|nr:formate dehydrogenase subunit gamma [Thiolinea sp.]
MNKPDHALERYNFSERANHWMVAILFVLAALSGLALFHPSLFWLGNLFGGGPWTRILHPFMGVLMFLFFLVLALRFWKHNGINRTDRQWLKQMSDVLANRDDKLPPVGRYNAGQKLLFWVMIVCMLTLLVTGILFWRPWFADSFPIGLVRFAALLHAFSAWVLIAGIMVHVYAAFWVKGTMGAMLSGKVSRAWARHHHNKWYREVTGDKRS